MPDSTEDAFYANLQAWRALTHAEQVAYLQSTPAYTSDPTPMMTTVGGSPTPAQLELVNRCPDRGGEVPISAYPEGCCTGPTRFACRAGLGTVPGQPTLADCLACVSDISARTRE